jgi:hypothetical protein
MQINIIRTTPINRMAATALLTCCFFQLAVGAQPSMQTGEYVKLGATALLGLARGETLRFSAFNPVPAGGESIHMQMKLYDAQGNVIAESARVVIPPGEFRSIDFNRDEILLAGDPGTGILQVRTAPLWGVRSLNRISVPTSLEVIDGSATRSSFKFYFVIEALP